MDVISVGERFLVHVKEPRDTLAPSQSVCKTVHSCSFFKPAARVHTVSWLDLSRALQYWLIVQSSTSTLLEQHGFQ